MKDSNKIISVVAHIHPDGDVYIKTKKGFHFVGYLVAEEESVFTTPTGKIASLKFPNEGYLQAKKYWLKK